MKYEKTELIKPKSKKKKNTEDDFSKYKKYISPTLMGIIGIVFLTNSNDIIIYACYILGAIIAGFGTFNIIKYLQAKKQFNFEDPIVLNTGIICITIGIIFIVLASIIKTFLNLIVGIWLITTAISKLIGINALYTIDRKSANLFTIEAFILLAMGLYTIFFQNIILTIVGIWLIISAVIDLYNLLNKKK